MSSFGSKTLKALVAASFAATVLAIVSPAFPCTIFLMEHEGGHYFGKSYDWHTSCGLVIVNKRGIDKRALVLGGDDTPAEWTSVHASVTFNQYGCEFPNGGVNDAGLGVEVAWLDRTEYPAKDARPMVNELQWIQYALDSFGSVADIVAAAPGLRVSPAYGNVHYMACDRSGACAAFEHLHGALVVTQDNELVVKTLTNDTYAASASYLTRYEGFGGWEPIPTGSGSLDRFVRASSLALAEPSGAAPQPEFAILDSVSQDASSVWNIIYDLDHRRAYFRTYAVPSIKRVDLSAFDPDCTSETMILDIDFEATGDVSSSFEPYTNAANKELVDKSFAPIIGKVPPGTPELAAPYPADQRCALPPGGTDRAEEAGGSGCAVGGNGDRKAQALLGLWAVAVAWVLARWLRAT